MDETDADGLTPYATESQMYFDLPECSPFEGAALPLTYSGVAPDPDIPGADEDEPIEAYF